MVQPTPPRGSPALTSGRESRSGRAASILSHSSDTGSVSNGSAPPPRLRAVGPSLAESKVAAPRLFPVFDDIIEADDAAEREGPSMLIPALVSHTSQSFGESTSFLVETPAAVLKRDTDGDVWSVNQYNVIATLGTGASGVVYLVESEPDSVSAWTSIGGTRAAAPAAAAWSGVVAPSFVSPFTSSPLLPLLDALDRTVAFEDGSPTCDSAAAPPLASTTDRMFAVKAMPRSKIMPAGASSTTDAMATEVAMMKRLEHPHVVRLHEVIDDPDQDTLFLVMDYVEGGAIAAVDAETGTICGRLSDQEIELFVTQQLQALRHVHDRGVVHGDYKLENVLFTGPRGAALHTKLGDFGIATLQQDAEACSASFVDAVSTRTKRVAVGTPYARAPELFERWAPSQAADVWALGVALYTLAFGRVPFHAPSLRLLAQAVTRNAVAPPADARPEAVARWWPVVARLLDRDPAARVDAFHCLANRGDARSCTPPRALLSVTAAERRKSIVSVRGAVTGMRRDNSALSNAVAQRRRTLRVNLSDPVAAAATAKGCHT